MNLENKIKLGFKKRQSIYGTIIIIGILHEFTPSPLKLGLMIALFLSVLLITIISIPKLKTQFMNLLIKEKKEPISIPEIITQAKKLKIKTDNISIWINNKKGKASTNLWTGQIKVYKNFYEKLNREELIFVLGHELGHLTKKLRLMAFPKIIPCMLLILFFYSSGIVISNIVIFPVFATFIITLNFITRWEEFKADEIGASMVSKEIAINAIKKAFNEEGLDYATDTHPSPNERIRNLENFYAKFSSN